MSCCKLNVVLCSFVGLLFCSSQAFAGGSLDFLSYLSERENVQNDVVPRRAERFAGVYSTTSWPESDTGKVYNKTFPIYVDMAQKKYAFSGPFSDYLCVPDHPLGHGSCYEFPWGDRNRCDFTPARPDSPFYFDPKKCVVNTTEHFPPRPNGDAVMQIDCLGWLAPFHVVITSKGLVLEWIETDKAAARWGHTTVLVQEITDFDDGSAFAVPRSCVPNAAQIPSSDLSTVNGPDGVRVSAA